MGRVALMNLVAGCALSWGLPGAAAELEGVRLEDRILVDGQELQLNGIALRTRMVIFKVYVAGLYLAERVASAQTALERDGAKRITLVMMREATAEQFTESIDTAMRANNTQEEIARVQGQVDALMAMIRRIGEAATGMVIALDFQPSAGGTTLFVDGAAQGPPMPGRNFYRVLLRIWLGENPVQEDLKRALLGAPQ